MKRTAVLLYGIVCYAVFLLTFLYAIGFVGNFVVPKSIDSGAEGPFWPSLLIDIGLLGLFGLQHSVMARPGFKRWWTRFVPQALERSTFVLFASLALILLYWQWRPLLTEVWSLDGPAATVLWAIFAVGWGIVLVSTFMISHAHLFGVRQVHDHFQGRPLNHPGFQTPGFYRRVRHPIMTGFLIAFWATPHMSVGHLLFALVTTAYILVALQFEERDLVNAFGQRYESYRKRVPMLIPRPRRPAVDASGHRADGPAQQER